jgi:hypothetical protein
MKAAVGILLVVGTTQIVGCAFGTRYVELSYPPENEVEIILPETQPAATGPRTHQVILAVHDARETRDRIGNVRNGFGMDTASILTEDNIEVWVHEAVIFELDQLGYQVLDHRGTPSDASADRLTATVQKVYCDIYAVYDGEVTLKATLERADEQPLLAEFPTKVSSGLNWLASGRATGESLAQALQTAIRSMLYDLGFAN